MTIQFGFEIEAKGHSPSLIEQVHGNIAVELGGPNLPKADAIFSFAPKASLHVFTADCLPVLLYSPASHGPIAAIHSGWRGAMEQITRQTLERLSDWRTSLHAVIGPCLRVCCFEVKEDFIATFSAKDQSMEKYLEVRSSRTFFDLPSYVTNEQILPFLPETRLNRTHLTCTFCGGLPSFRRNKSTDPRIRAWISRG